MDEHRLPVCAAEEPITHEQINEEFDKKVRAGIFRPVARFLTTEVTVEDRLEDAICQVWWMFHRYTTEKDTILDDALLVRACRLRATDLARRFVGSNGANCRNQDALDLRLYRDGGVVVFRLDGIDAA